MAPRVARKRRSPSLDPEGIFRGMNVFLVPGGMRSQRLKVWKQKLLQMGAKVEDGFSERVTHIFAIDFRSLLQQVSFQKLQNFEGSLINYQWLEDCLKSGEKLPYDSYTITSTSKEHAKLSQSCNDDLLSSKRSKTVAHGLRAADDSLTAEDSMIGVSFHEDSDKVLRDEEATDERKLKTQSDSDGVSSPLGRGTNVPEESKELSSLYSPPDLNKDITEIFGKLVNIYRALGDERRSFSYQKAIPVIEKLSFKIENVDQVKHLPAIGKSLQDHIQEIVSTRKLSKLEHFEKDEKIFPINRYLLRSRPSSVHLFEEPLPCPLSVSEVVKKRVRDLQEHASVVIRERLNAMMMKLGEHKTSICIDMKRAQLFTSQVVVICGGSYRRGKASCGDLDIIITHPDGESHKGFLPKYVQRLKDINFLREDLVFSIHSTEGTDSGVDTYFGLCTYPGREQRHRIDFKVYPKSIYAFGLIAWTGNDVLNRRLRLLAESKGYRLDDTGLFLATRSMSGKQGMRSSTSVSCNTEKEVFELLGFPWLEPHERNL
ncbi:DNA polymerase lambda [Phalaenopsis equestris]|uniref:DNA polymerase lambda n=1 Tax=Phalaenopsis equestris TaxID=78828 RepID=UPI0009E34429|nr:DNA polymerase lambda [Phalaenopsis equestris]